MKFIKLNSRGGNYLVVAENVAWLRTAENGQTSVGIVGGQPLLVVGSIEEVADQILSGTAEEPSPTSAAAPASPPPAVTAQMAAPAELADAKVPQSAPPEPDSEPPLPQPAAVDPAPIVTSVPAPVASKPGSKPVSTSAKPRPVSRNSASLWERPAAASASSGIKVKVSSQRMMGRFE
ncbi:hypothetical protein [Erythrobacter sp. R86502]|uniref:hypothetical protein n=1 Tax=Erythrobacter sp. R86502 TaxID=3093846 RepID=UPI0036D31DBC